MVITTISTAAAYLISGYPLQVMIINQWKPVFTPSFNCKLSYPLMAAHFCFADHH